MTGQKKSREIQEDTNFNKKGNQGGKAELDEGEQNWKSLYRMIRLIFTEREVADCIKAIHL